MHSFLLRKTVVRESAHEAALREFGEHSDSPPVHIDVERFDQALAGLTAGRTIVPNGLSVEDICRFMDHIAAGK